MSCQPCGCDPEAQHQCESYPACRYGRDLTRWYGLAHKLDLSEMSVSATPPPEPIQDETFDICLPPSVCRRIDEVHRKLDRKFGASIALPEDPKERKRRPIATGVLDYFPDAIAEVALVSFAGNEQHNPGQPLHWAREKSTDHADCIGRHLLQRGTRDTDQMRHSAKLAWRALANLQIEIENERTNQATKGGL